MDVKRIVLYVAVVLVGFLLWNAWQIEHPAVVTSPTAQVYHETSTIIPATTSPAIITASAEASTDPITITTDVMSVTLNAKNGTLTRVQLLKYPLTEKQKNVPVTLLNTDPESLYIASSGILSQEKLDSIVFSAPQKTYVLKNGEERLDVVLSGNDHGLLVTKTFSFSRNSYTIPVTYHLKNTTSTAWTGSFVNTIQRKEVPSTAPGVLHYSTFLGAAISTPDQHYQKYSFSSMAENNINTTGTGGWLAMMQHYFISAWVPDQTQSTHYFSQEDGNNTVTLGMVGPQMSLSPGQELTQSMTFYSGPTVSSRLQQVAPYLHLTVDYGWLWFISAALFWVMKHIYDVIGNWGWSIVAVTILIKAVFYKLSETSYRSMARMRQLQPKIEALKERYADDKQKLGSATMELYRKEKVNPLGGCLPIIIQIPVFLALYYVLIESVELRQAPFMLWIHNLSQPDPYFILPVLMGISMFLQQKLSPAPADPTQAKIMMIMPIVFTVFFLYFPAGLVLYWFVNNLVSLLQQWFITRRVQSGADNVVRHKRKK